MTPAEAREVARRYQYPHVLKASRYCFYVVCSFGVGLLGYAAVKALGFNHDVQRMASGLIAVASFIYLRDCEKNAIMSDRLLQETRDGE